MKKHNHQIIEQVPFDYYQKRNGKVWNDAHLHSFNIKKLEKMLKRSGFTILYRKKFNFNMAMVFCAKK